MYTPKSADELLKEVPTDPQSLSSRMVNDELAAKTSISDAVGASMTNDVKLFRTLFEQIGIAKAYFDSLEAVAGKEQALVDKAETKLDEELAFVAQKVKDEHAAIEKAKADAKLKYEAEVNSAKLRHEAKLKQIEADGQFNLEHIRSKKGAVEEAQVTLLKSSGKTQTRLKALVKIGRQGVATLKMAATSSNADEPEFKTSRDRLVVMQRAWKRAQESGDDGILKEEILEGDLDVQV